MVMEQIKEDLEIRIKKWLEQLQKFRNPVPILETKPSGETNIQAQIREAAYYLALKHLSYKDLCWNLAENIQKKNVSVQIEKEIRKTAEEISKSSKTYDELCWVNAKIGIMSKK
ncbi:MAG: hypothetical protein ACFFDF_16485 [Candidatus Odinarchaeota archaeon]